MSEVQTSEPAAIVAARAARKTFRLFKRDDHGRELSPQAEGYRDRPYYFKFTFHKKCYVRCLETPDAELAQKNARAKSREIRDSALRGDLQQLDRTKLRATAVGTIQQLIAAYKLAPVDAGANSRKQNAHALLQILRTAEEVGRVTPCAPSQCEPLPISSINAAAARKWFETASTRALALEDQTEVASAKRSANSRFVQAKSLFVPKAIAIYKEKNLFHPNYLEFVNAGETFKFSKLPVTSFNPPSDTIIQNTLASWEKIDTTTDDGRNLFLAIGHELAFGLRVSELAQCQWGLWTTRESYPVLDGNITVKNGTGTISVRALDPWFTTLASRIQVNRWNTGPDDFILAGNPTDRNDGTPRAVSAWMRELGWKTVKTNHELRKYAGSQIAMRYGIYDAQCWLRHSTVKVTEQNYSTYIKRFKPADVTTLAARWAQAPAVETPTLRILQAS